MNAQALTRHQIRSLEWCTDKIDQFLVTWLDKLPTDTASRQKKLELAQEVMVAMADPEVYLFLLMFGGLIIFDVENVRIRLSRIALDKLEHAKPAPEEESELGTRS